MDGPFLDPIDTINVQESKSSTQCEWVVMPSSFLFFFYCRIWTGQDAKEQ